MFDGLAEEVVLKAKARTGASGELGIWIFLIAVSSVTALVFLSVAGYVWLSASYGSAAGAAIVGAAHVLLVAAAAGRCAVLRRRNKLRARLAIEAAKKTAPWWSDPTVLAIGYEVAKVVGWRKMTPLIAAGVLAATLGRKNGGRQPRYPSGNGSAT